MQSYVDSIDELDLFIKHRSLNDLLQAQLISNKDVFGIMFMSQKDPTKYVLNGPVIGSDFFETFPKSSLYQKIYDNDGKAVCAPLQITLTYNTIAVGRAVRNVQTGETLGLIMVFVDEWGLSKVINSMMEKEANVDSGQNGYLE